MKRIIPLLILIVFLSSIISAEIIITQQPDDVYSLGELISIPITIKSLTDLSGSFEVNLICSGNEINFYKNGISLSQGQEKRMEASVILTQEVIGELRGDCKIKAGLKEDYVLTEDFQISSLMNIQVTSEKTEFEPGKSLIIKGTAVKASGENVKGFIELILGGNVTAEINQLETINNGYFSINISLPENMKAGIYGVTLNAYEKNSLGEVTNQGSTNHQISIKQIPTSLEIFFENIEIEPGTNLKAKSILHDQTGESIDSSAIMTLKNQIGETLMYSEKHTSEFLEYPVAYNEAPSNWTITSISGILTSEVTCRIIAKEDIKAELINKTLLITNTGNVQYNKSILIKIGNESLNIDVLLDVDEDQKYVLSAPKGEYNVEVITDEGSKITGMVTLTGKAVNVKESSGLGIITYPFVWIFIIAVLGFIAFLVFKKGHKRVFLGRKHSTKKTNGKDKASPLRKNSIVTAINKAELSLSIKGNKQNSSIICIKIKNLQEIQSKKSNAEETLQKIVSLAESNKAAVYENQNNLFFILAPVRTRTFKNEKTALNLSQDIQKTLVNHNKLAKQKIEFGISLNYGTIVAKQEKESLKFMSMGTLITTAKKVSSLSEGEILLSENIKDKLRSEVKTEKQKKGNINVYTIKEIKHNGENKKFLRDFLNKTEKK
jgi:hypothetical protein